MKWLRVAAEIVRRNLSGTVVVVVAAALVSTVFGLGAMGQAPEVFDGSAWVWSRTAGEMARVSANSSSVDLRQPVVDSRGHRLQVTQNEEFLILHDLETGRVTSVDLARMGFSGSLAVDAKNDVTVVVSADGAAVVDRTQGLVRLVDPATLQVKGELLQLPAPLVGGAYDGSGTLWVGLPGQGTVVGLGIENGALAIRSTVPVATPGHDLAVTVLDNGVLAFDRSGNEMVAVTGDKPRRMTAPVRLAGAMAPDRTVGPLASVTVHSAKVIINIENVVNGGSIHSLPVPTDTGTVAVPFAGRVYLPDNKAHVVYVYGVDGKPAETIKLAGVDGPIELQVREQHLFINAPDAPVASVVDRLGRVRLVDKYETGTPDPGSSADAGPAQSAPPSGDPSTPEPGDETATDGPSLPDPARPDSSPPRPEPPGAPVPVTALAGDREVKLTWGRSAPGGAPVDRYTVTWDGGSRTLDGNTLETAVRGLTNGKSYRFRVRATNRYGEGPPALSGLVTPVDTRPPAAPDRPTATVDGRTVTVTWPGVNGARDYVVTPLRNGTAGANPPQTVGGTRTEFTGLTLGATYTFTVVAQNEAGVAGAASPASNSVVPYGAPGVPGDVSGRQTGTNSYRITWSEAVDNGRPITRYVVRDQGGNQIATAGSGARSADVTATGLTRVQVLAENAAGLGREASAPVTTIKRPTVTITGTDATKNSVTVNFTVANGGAAATCRITLTPSGKSADACDGSHRFTGLAAGTTYTVEITAENVVGSGTATKKQRTDAATYRGRVTCNDKPSNPDPLYCTETGGIGVFTSPNFVQGGDHHRVRTGSTVTVTCRATGSDMNADVYNNYKKSKIWLKMNDGFWISWVWVTLDNGVNVNTVPNC